MGEGQGISLWALPVQTWEYKVRSPLALEHSWGWGAGPCLPPRAAKREERMRAGSGGYAPTSITGILPSAPLLISSPSVTEFCWVADL